MTILSFPSPARLPRVSAKYLAGETAIHGHRFPDLFPLDPTRLRRLIARRGAGPFPRERLAEILSSYLAPFDPPPAARAALADLRSPACFAVVTGQQPGLAGGPLYLFWKTLTTLRLTRELRALLPEYRFVTLFWNASDDHNPQNFGELYWPGEGFHLSCLRPFGTASSSRPAYARALPDPAAWLPPEITIPGDGKTHSHRRAWQDYFSALPREDAGSAFTRLWLKLFGGQGLLLLEPRWLRTLSGELYAKELSDPAASSRLLQKSWQDQADAGLEPATLGREPPLLYYHEREERHRLLTLNQDFALRGQALCFTRPELLSRPERLSPAAALRPVIEASLLPGIFYVPGPHELAYLSLTDPLFARFGVEPPALFPRWQGTLVENKVARALDRLGWSPEQALAHPLPQPDISPPPDLESSAAACRLALAGYRETLSRHFPGLAETAAQGEQQAGKALERLEKKSRDALLCRDELRHHSWLLCRQHLAPDGELQERRWPLLYFLLHHGEERLLSLERELPLDPRPHYWIPLDPPP